MAKLLANGREGNQMKKINEKKLKSKLTYIFKTYGVPPELRVKIFDAIERSFVEDGESKPVNWPF